MNSAAGTRPTLPPGRARVKTGAELERRPCRTAKTSARRASLPVRSSQGSGRRTSRSKAPSSARPWVWSQVHGQHAVPAHDLAHEPQQPLAILQHVLVLGRDDDQDRRRALDGRGCLPFRQALSVADEPFDRRRPRLQQDDRRSVLLVAQAESPVRAAPLLGGHDLHPGRAQPLGHLLGRGRGAREVGDAEAGFVALEKLKHRPLFLPPGDRKPSRWYFAPP
jgi:hypothetical protein